MIRIENLYKSYKGHKVLKGLNIEVHRGEIYGFIGHNGVGKSTTMNILAGLIGFQSGKCIINGRDSSGKGLQNKDIGYLPEDPKFYPYMNAWEYFDFIGRIGGDTGNTIKEKSTDLLERVGLSKAAKRPIGGYSRGMKQRLGLAVAMYHDPHVYLLDEPSSALDPEGRLDMVNIIEELKDHGKTVFLSTHILNDIERICDRVGIIHDGRIVVEERLDSLMAKYVQPVYDIEFAKKPGRNLADNFMKLDYVEKVDTQDNKISVTIKDLEKDSQNLLREIAGLNVFITSINLRRNSLEEIFMKVVK
ncbi:MAG TPA: ABC transporter ATP-binding protein [Pseudobacteroides sp.]|uniref:ABC transporter ATP-binding protein n=1 Tax=Pseudobacteroides sp. TaxID=1968840 RepID=UPI002F9237F2